MKYIIGVTLLGLLISSTVAAEIITLGRLIEINERGGEPARISEQHVGALGKGMEWANGYLKSKNRERIYCPPGKLAITNDQYFEILSKSVIKFNLQNLQGDKAGLALVLGLVDTFPCE